MFWRRLTARKRTTSTKSVAYFATSFARRPMPAFENSSSQTYEALARSLKNLLQRADLVLDNPAYNMVIHTAPVQEGPMEHYHWHVEFIPRLTKIAGFEWGTGFYQNPTPPE